MTSSLTEGHRMSEHTNPATLYIRKLQEDASRTGTAWTELGKTIDAPRFTPGPEALKAFHEIGAELHKAIEQLGKGFTLSFKAAFPHERIRALQRILIAPDPRRCYTCQRRFRGPWQRIKHERTAH